MGLEHMSVPRWSAAVPEVDKSGRDFAIMSFGDSGRSVAHGWRTGLAGLPVWGWHDDSADACALGALRERLAAATVGWRLMVAGPEPDVMRVRAVARRAGTLDEEITAYVTESDRRVIWCAHCGCEAEYPVADRNLCSGCERSLVAHPHFSRRHAAYLGFQADAEESP